MPLWRPEPTSLEPSVRALRWRVVECEFAERDPDRVTRHVVCWCGEGRVSSRIASWDPVERIATTRSGRRYELPVSHEGRDPDAEYVFARWGELWGVTSVQDVTGEYA